MLQTISELMAIKQVTLKSLQENKFLLVFNAILFKNIYPVKTFGKICPKHYIEAEGLCINSRL
jgi:hypothetical protein